MKIAVVKEAADGEARVALVPESVQKLVSAGHSVSVEPGAGAAAQFDDAMYLSAGATLRADNLRDCDLVASVQPLTLDRIAHLAAGTTTVSFLPAPQELDRVEALRRGQVTALALEFVPRISRAQSMDALSSQALIAGYRSAVVAAELFRRFFPLNMTAAGTVRPAQVVVLGAGVAGLQAIATCKRLGSVVKAYDVRAAAAEEIRSMGAKVIDLELETLEGSGGYAREMTSDRSALQRELLAPYIAAADVVITTAAVPGRAAPLLVTADMVRAMKPGSVIVDLAAETGGNVEGAQPGKVVTIGGTRLWGADNVPSQMPGVASSLLAQNIVNLVSLVTGEDSGLALDFDDEIVAGACITHAGVVRHARTLELLEVAAS